MKIGCVITLYNPNPNLLGAAIEAVINQVSAVFIADNSPKPCYSPSDARIVYAAMGYNAGIAAAQNRGIRHFMQQDYDYVLLLDQDSIVQADAVEVLLNAYDLLSANNVRAAAVCPRPINRLSNKEYRGLIKKGTEVYPNITDVMDVISSGNLVSINTFKEVGLFDEKLFIDDVDLEWCWRSKYKFGYRLFYNEQTTISHQIGEGDRFFLFRKIHVPTPFRAYYLYRNYLWLLRRNYVPLYFKLSNAVKLSARLFFYMFACRPQRQYCIRILQGIRDGIIKCKTTAMK